MVDCKSSFDKAFEKALAEVLTTFDGVEELSAEQRDGIFFAARMF